MAVDEYVVLREQIEVLLQEGQQFGRRAAEWEKVETYWHIGDALSRFLDRQGGSTYGEQTLQHLGRDLRMGRAVLYDILRFRRQIPSLQTRTNLGWSHYRALLRLPPTDAARYEELADLEGWTTRQLKRAIESDGVLRIVDDHQPQAAALQPHFGRPFTYRILGDPYEAAGPPAIDFGFHQLWVPTDLPGIEMTAPGDRITLERSGARTVARVCDGRATLWTYIAHVTRIIDGDTLDVVVDLGLGHRAFTRLRLRGIDTPELYTDAGRGARSFVEDALADAPMIIIATRRTDSYGRYLADVKYQPGCSDSTEILRSGTYVNEELLKQGLASRYTG